MRPPINSLRFPLRSILRLPTLPPPHFLFLLRRTVTTLPPAPSSPPSPHSSTTTSFFTSPSPSPIPTVPTVPLRDERAYIPNRTPPHPLTRPPSFDSEELSPEEKMVKAKMEELLEREGGGGVAGIQTEDGRPTEVKRAVRESMFRYI